MPIQWTPDDYLDEIGPPGRDNPSDWIVGRDGDGWRLADMEGNDGPVADTPAPLRIIVAEGAVVSFSSYEGLGRYEIEVDADGGITSDGGAPSGNCYWTPGDSDTLADSLAEFATLMAEADGAGVYEVAVGRWSDAIKHRLIVTDGVASFVPLTAATTQ